MTRDRERRARDYLTDRGYDIHDCKHDPLRREVFLPDGPGLGEFSLHGLLHLAELERVKRQHDDLQGMLRQLGNIIRQAEQI